MSKEYDPSGRFKILSVGELMAPAHCAICGNGTCEHGYVDFGLSFDYEGCVYFCVTCALEIGEVVGLYTPEEVKIVHTLAEGLAAENAELLKELEYARPIVSIFSRSVSNAVQSGDLPLVDAGPNAKGTVADAAEPPSGTDGGEPSAEEPTLSTGRSRKGGSSKLRDVAFE